MADAPPAGDELVLDEDDWRQVELVSRAFAAESDVEIAAIRAIHEQESASVGWKKIHVRKRPDPPIASSLSRNDIAHAFGSVTFHAVCFGNSPIASAFSFRAEKLQCYGIEEDGTVTVLGIAEHSEQEEGVDALARIAHEFDLERIHWCRCARATWDDSLFRRILTGDI